MQEYWKALSFPSQGNLPDPWIEPVYPALQTESLPLSHQGSPDSFYSTFNFNYFVVPHCLFSSSSK